MDSFSKYHIMMVVIFLFVLVNLESNSAKPVGGDEEFVAFAEVMPAPVGGMASIVKLIKYPEIARQSQVQGRVYILAYIDENGVCSEAKVIKGIGAGCDEAAVEAVKSVKYTTGKNKGKPVKVKLSLPLEFRL